MKIAKNIFRGYDLRGLVGKELSAEIFEHLGKAHGTYMKRNGVDKAIVARDCRETSKEYGDALIRGYSWAGIDTIDIGMTLIGTFYWAQYFLDSKGGAYITASHNPAEYNGAKFAIGFSETLVSESIQELRKMVEEEDYEQGKTLGKVEEKDINQEYFNDLLKRLPIEKKFKIVVDPGNSTPGSIAPNLLEQAGCEVVRSNCGINPSFPLGTPDPTETFVAERLRDKVLEAGADIGFSYDSDGDRIGIVDDKGGIIWNDVLLALFAIDVLHEHPGEKIMYNTLCSRVVDETIKKYGGEPFMWRTGHSFLKKKNQEVKAAFIGELSGHFFFSKDYYNHDDGLYSTLRLLHLLSRTGQSLSKAVAELPQYISSPEIKVGCPDDLKVGLMDKVAEKLRKDFPNAEVIDDERAGDGVRLDMKDSMFVIRYSQNGPYLTVKFEAKKQGKHEELKKYISDLLHSYNEIDWSFGVNVESLD